MYTFCVDALPYISGSRPANPGLLSRFLPQLEDGTVSAWLTHHASPGTWLLDPFGFSPRLILESARAGYRVLVTANNPITRFLVEMAASAPSEAELKAALADLAASRKADERLENHLQSLYLTACAKCGAEIPAKAFLWKKDSDAPFARVYECPHCDDKGEYPVTPADVERAKEIMRTAGLHRARVLERVAPLNDPDREYAEEALQVYLPRAIYALATLINRLDGLDVSPEHHRMITALVLAACDAGNSLWTSERPRPKQLSVPNQFRENNLWMALEEGIGLLAETSSKVPCEAWPKKIPEGGICLFDGRLKTLAEEVRKEIPIAVVVAAVPRPNQAFWTLSALWAGWLWGREAAEPFKVGLRRRRYDWAWNATALNSSFHHLSDLLPAGTPLFGLLTEAEPLFVTSAFTAADAAGFDLKGVALRTEHDPLQTVWTRGDSSRARFTRDLEPVRRVIRSHLTERGEPARYLYVHTAVLTELAAAHQLKNADEEFDDALRKTNALIESALTGDARFAHHSTGENVETGMWGLRESDAFVDSLADRVEMAIVNYVQKNPESIYLEIENELYARFPGLLTPSKGLIYRVLYSYTRRESGAWKLRSEDMPSVRRAELKQMAELIEAVGVRLGYTTRKDDKALIWEENGATERVFYVIASALIGRVVAANAHPSEKCVIVFPGGRAALAAYKQQRDLALADHLRGWHMLKFRLLRALADIPVLNHQTFEEQITSDPVEQAEGQLMMF